MYMVNARYARRHMEILRLLNEDPAFADGGVIAEPAEWRHQLHEDIDSGR